MGAAKRPDIQDISGRRSSLCQQYEFYCSFYPSLLSLTSFYVLLLARALLESSAGLVLDSSIMPIIPVTSKHFQRSTKPVV